MKFVTLLSALFLTGCSSVPGLYTEIGLGIKYAPTTSAVLRPECHVVLLDGGYRSCGGDNPTAHFCVGFEFEEHNGRIEGCHQSHYFDGGSDRETHMDQVRYVYRVGGRE